jgi:hypothetical protein
VLSTTLMTKHVRRPLQPGTRSRASLKLIHISLEYCALFVILSLGVSDWSTASSGSTGLVDEAGEEWLKQATRSCVVS